MFRLYHKLYAKLFHYYWLPCPVCGKFYGGHEVKEIVSIAIDGCNKQICPSQKCAYEAGYINAINGVPLLTKYNYIPKDWKCEYGTTEGT